MHTRRMKDERAFVVYIEEKDIWVESEVKLQMYEGCSYTFIGSSVIPSIQNEIHTLYYSYVT